MMNMISIEYMQSCEQVPEKTSTEYRYSVHTDCLLILCMNDRMRYDVTGYDTDMYRSDCHELYDKLCLLI